MQLEGIDRAGDRGNLHLFGGAEKKNDRILSQFPPVQSRERSWSRYVMPTQVRLRDLKKDQENGSGVHFSVKKKSGRG